LHLLEPIDGDDPVGASPDLNGGEDSKSGRNTVQRADGTGRTRRNDQREMQPGDVFIIETPGGGGFSAP
jgi:N-methylhydantoinase B/oxoprolinase/acetone carboxylase alpha subunit